MRKIATVVLITLLVAVMGSVVQAADGHGTATGPRTADVQLTWNQPANLKTSGLMLANLAFEPNPRLGLGFPPHDLSTYFLFPQCGFGVVRFTVYWRYREPAKGDFKWNAMDNKIKVLQGLGIDVFLTFQCDAPWGTEATDLTAANRPPRDMNDWSDFVAHVVQRYNKDGVDDMPGLLRPVKYYQFINEWPSPQNNYGGWTGTIDQLIDLLNASYDAVKGNDPEATVVLGGIPSIGLDAMVLNAGEGNYTARRFYNDTVQDSLTVDIAQHPLVDDAVATRERVLAESRYDMADLHLYGPVEYNQYRIDRIRESVGDTPLLTAECGGPNLAYDPVITPEEHFLAALDINLDGLSRDLKLSIWLSMFGREYDPNSGPTWGNSQLQLIDANHQPTGGFWGYHLLAAILDGMTSVEKPGPGQYIVHREDRPDIFVGWQTDQNATYQLPPTIQASEMMVVTDALYGIYEIDTTPADGLLELGPLPTVVSEELPGGAYVTGGSPTLVPVEFP